MNVLRFFRKQPKLRQTWYLLAVLAGLCGPGSIAQAQSKGGDQAMTMTLTSGDFVPNGEIPSRIDRHLSKSEITYS